MNKKGMEVSALVTTLIVVIFLLIMVSAYVVFFGDGFFSGDGNICERTYGLIRGCS